MRLTLAVTFAAFALVACKTGGDGAGGSSEVRSIEVPQSARFSRYYFASPSGGLCGSDCGAGANTTSGIANCPARALDEGQITQALQTDEERQAWQIVRRWISQPTMQTAQAPTSTQVTLQKIFAGLDAAYTSSRAECGDGGLPANGGVSESELMAQLLGLRVGGTVRYMRELSAGNAPFRYPYGQPKLTAVFMDGGSAKGKLELRTGAFVTETQQIDAELSQLVPIVGCDSLGLGITEGRLIPNTVVFRPAIPQRGVARACTKASVCLLETSGAIWMNVDQACDWHDVAPR